MVIERDLEDTRMWWCHLSLRLVVVEIHYNDLDTCCTGGGEEGVLQLEQTNIMRQYE